MNLIHAVLLLHSGKKEINEESLKKVAEATGDKIEDAQIKSVISALDGVNIDEAMEKASVVSAAAPAAPVSEGNDDSKKDENKEEEEAKSAESAAEGLGALFG